MGDWQILKIRFMKIFHALLIAFTISYIGCQKDDLQKDVPVCIQQKIEEFDESSISCDSGATVYKYQFQSQFVFVFNPGNCIADGASSVYDEECDLICNLGGLIGNITCNGENFSEKATDETLIWKN